jgi:hypothetical protein
MTQRVQRGGAAIGGVPEGLDGSSLQFIARNARKKGPVPSGRYDSVWPIAPFCLR